MDGTTSNPMLLNATQAAAVCDQLAPMVDYLSRLNARLREVGYDNSAPLLDDAVLACTRLRFLQIRLEEMTDPVKGEQARIESATPRRRIQPWSRDDLPT